LILLLNELHDELSSKGFILSVSLSITENSINGNLYNISTIERYVDFINLLTFEFHVPTNNEHNTGPNAPLEPNENDSMHDQRFTIHYAVDHWLKTTLDSKKLVNLVLIFQLNKNF
jgi:GH18 family chitinase